MAHDSTTKKMLLSGMKQIQIVFDLLSLSHGCLCCRVQVEAFVVEMQDPKTGVKGTEQKLNVTTIPHVITGKTRHRHHVCM